MKLICVHVHLPFVFTATMRHHCGTNETLLGSVKVTFVYMYQFPKGGQQGTGTYKAGGEW